VFVFELFLADMFRDKDELVPVLRHTQFDSHVLAAKSFVGWLYCLASVGNLMYFIFLL